MATSVSIHAVKATPSPTDGVSRPWIAGIHHRLERPKSATTKPTVRWPVVCAVKKATISAPQIGPPG